MFMWVTLYAGFTLAVPQHTVTMAIKSEELKGK